MNRFIRRSSTVLVVLALGGSTAHAQERPLAEFFRHETERIAATPLLDIRTAEDWKSRRPALQRQLREMMGLDPLPERTPLHVTITGTVERPEFVVDKLHFQSSPGLYVTANLYRPRTSEGRLPAILYVCGHGAVVRDGVIYGNKTHYNHHAAWYAANGYVCLVVDTLQLGEVPGLHHGTAREGMWWWFSRGYTPAGIEAWNGLRAIDYLASRVDVDPKRIGVTGRSGGGATSWWLGALDDRIAAVAPVAGITDLQNHVVDGCVEGHCDCMYFVNTYRWDYTVLAALCAPKPLLVENTNRDPIFPEDGVRRIFEALKTVYNWYGASANLELLIGDGGHVDSIQVRHPSFAFFERRLKGVPDPQIREPDRKLPVEVLKVLRPGELPSDAINQQIHERFVKPASPEPLPADLASWSRRRSELLTVVSQKVFRGWPESPTTSEPHALGETSDDTATARVFALPTQPGIQTFLLLISPKGRPSPTELRLVVAGPELVEKADLDFVGERPPSEQLRRLKEAGVTRGTPDQALLIVAPRGVGPTAWAASRDVQTQRRFYLLGQTLDGMRVWDVRRAIQEAKQLPGLGGVRNLTASGTGPMAAVALWASIFEPSVTAVELVDPPATIRDGPAFLNLERVCEMPQALALLYPRPLTVVGGDRARWPWLDQFAAKVGASGEWPRFVPARHDP